ncbi:hypothetical protein BJF86_14950 [Serinicoccus sp. CNJ-927]|uniref:hypothetical protein n=1 Tax=unclassified Serinicoccus TaxID=2643101 RepID=UPI00095AFE94|nr:MULTISPECIES: hypothetical protein [unclassified Serinicoccus]OLT17566.1 hypothetical protein BJF80_16555 [Serinicoccus sp. CUA-874]OLT24557.1 hypothetical protein BJF82_13290 [Kytococcus sp. CUA-901]OLT42488.1 hypothetical protein BJF86_14950 [Serinicoccus sp. CNJ-927]
MFPDAEDKPAYGFILAGAVAGPLIWVSLVLMADLGVALGATLRPFAPLIGLSVMVSGLLIEFGRYLHSGRDTAQP